VDFFSILICFLLLFRIEGAHATTWILPFLVVGYGYYLYASPPVKQRGLFPEESYVQRHYVERQEGLSQHDLLLKGWHLYLVNEWAKESPSENPTVFEKQLDKGLFAFNIARLNSMEGGREDEAVLAGFTSHPSLLRVLCYFLWNLVFAWLINRHTKVSQSERLLNPS